MKEIHNCDHGKASKQFSTNQQYK